MRRVRYAESVLKRAFFLNVGHPYAMSEKKFNFSDHETLTRIKSPFVPIFSTVISMNWCSCIIRLSYSEPEKAEISLILKKIVLLRYFHGFTSCVYGSRLPDIKRVTTVYYFVYRCSIAFMLELPTDLKEDGVNRKTCTDRYVFTFLKKTY